MLILSMKTLNHFMEKNNCYITAFLSLLGINKWNQLVKPAIKDPKKPKLHLLCHTTFRIQLVHTAFTADGR
jgi:hypothetical protein